MKNYNWILALLCLATSPLNATTVDTSYDTDGMLSRYMKKDAAHEDRGGDGHRSEKHHRETRRPAWHDRPFRHDDSESSDRDLPYPLHRLMRSHRKIHYTESFDIEEPGTYQVYLDDFDYDIPPVYFGIKFSDGYTHRRVAFTKNENGFLFEAMPGEYDISIRARGHHRFHLDDFDLRLVAIDTTPVPVPAAIWLFGSGLIGMLGLARLRGYSKDSASIDR